MWNNAEFVTKYVDNLKKRIDELTQALLVSDTKLDFLEAERLDYEGRQEELRVSRDNLEKKVAALEIDNSRLGQEHAASRTSAGDLDREVMRLRNDASELGTALSRAKTELEAERSVTASLRAELARAEELPKISADAPKPSREKKLKNG